MTTNEIRQAFADLDGGTTTTNHDQRFQSAMMAEIAAQLATANARAKIKIRLALYGARPDIVEELEKL